MTIRFFGPKLREACAEARAVLLEMAAEVFKAPADRLVAENGVIFDRTQRSNRVTYSQLSKGKIIERHLKGKAPLEDVTKFTVVGKPFLRTDAQEKVTGKAKYAGDIRLPGMLYAGILRPPSHGASLKSVDPSAAKQIMGVLVVQDGDLIAALHEHPDTAQEALGKIRADFEPSKSRLDDRNILDHLLEVAPGGSVVKEGGNIETG
jgi:isoquinoline 1-oxidoreductase